MKTIGLLGGMSWESTVGYYCAINEGIKAALGELHSAKIAMVSIDFDPIAKLQHKGDWEETGRLLAEAAKSIQAAGADFLLICANTMHKVAPQIEAAIDIPILHVADATAGIIKQRGIKTVGLLGTAFTMEQSFFKGRLEEKHGIHVIVPNEEDRKVVHDIIYHELCLGQQLDASRTQYLSIIDTLAAEGAEAVILGCTEIGMLVNQSDTDVMLLDTTAIHAENAVQAAIE
jgi:aspartate racemase